MEKKQLFKTTVNDLKLFVFQYFSDSSRPETIFTLSYDLETAGKQVANLLDKKKSPNIDKVNIIGNIPVHEVLNQVETFKVDKEVKVKLQSKSSFIYSLKLAAERWVKSNEDKKVLARIISAVDDH